MLKKILFFSPAVSYYALIFFLSSKPLHIQAITSPFDKLIHFIEFSLLGFLISFGFFKSLRLPLKTQTIFIFLSGGLLGILDEVHQSFVPGRYLDIFDALSDLAGLVLGIFLYKFILKKSTLKIFSP